MVTRQQFVDEVRSWIDTPYRHQGRTKGVAVDCGGLLVVAAKNLGLTEFDIVGYTAYPQDGELERACGEQMTRILPGAAKPGDVLLFEWDGQPTHIGILTGPNMVTHAFMRFRKVVEHEMTEEMSCRLWAAYHLPGVED